MAKKITKKQIQYIQAKRRTLGISDELYAEMKASVGATSTRELTNTQFNQLIQRMGVVNGANVNGDWSGNGYKPVHKSARASGMDKKPPADRAPLLGKIEALLAEQTLPWAYADGIAFQMFGRHKVRWCDPVQLRKVVAALVYRQKRLSAPAADKQKQ